MAVFIAVSLYLTSHVLLLSLAWTAAYIGLNVGRVLFRPRPPALPMSWFLFTDEDEDWDASNARAERLLLNNLSRKQTLQWRAARRFTVKGGETGARYWINPGLVSTKGWHTCVTFSTGVIPGADRALALKLAFEHDEVAARKMRPTDTPF